MPRKALHFASAIAAGLLAVLAPQASHASPQQDGLNTVNDIDVSSIPGAPFSATVVIEVEFEWPEGYTEVRRTINIIARDSLGRTHTETRRLMPEHFHGSPQLINARLFDPQTRIRTVYDPARHVASQQLVPPESKSTSLPNSAVRTEDLGASTLNGLQTKGTRRTFTLSAKASGVGERVEIEDEEWYSDDLHMDLLVRHSDPRIGTETIGVSNLKREEPPASMFDVPAGYRILNLTPSPAHPTVPAPTGAGVPADPPRQVPMP